MNEIALSAILLGGFALACYIVDRVICAGIRLIERSEPHCKHHHAERVRNAPKTKGAA